MTTQSIINQLRQPVERVEATELPRYIEHFSRCQEERLSVQYIHLLFNWMNALEKQHYKRYQLKTDDNYERRLERVLLFIEFSRQESIKDGALLMSIWRYQFGAVEVLLMCKRHRIAIAEDRERILGKLRHPDVVFLKTVLTINQKIMLASETATPDKVLSVWVEYKTSKGSPPKKVAITNFQEKYTRYEEVFNERKRLERSWVSRIPEAIEE